MFILVAVFFSCTLVGALSFGVGYTLGVKRGIDLTFDRLEAEGGLISKKDLREAFGLKANT